MYKLEAMGLGRSSPPQLSSTEEGNISSFHQITEGQTLLEDKFQCKLNDSGFVALGADNAKTARAVYVSGGRSEDYPVEQVEHLGPKFQILRFPNIHSFEH